MSASFDAEAFRARFPSLTSGWAQFDSPGGTQTPREVADAISATLLAPLSNRGSSAPSERNAETAVADFRAALGDYLGTDPGGIVHGRSATALTYDLSRALAVTWSAGDEIVLSQLDHDANVRPWVQAAERAGVTVRWLRIDPGTADLDLADLDDVITERTQLVAVTGASNLLGTIPDVERIAARAHAVGAHVHVDAVHLAAHAAIDPDVLGTDTLVCSPYKFFGPHLGVLAGGVDVLERLRPDKLAPSPDHVPERFELGTLPYELLAGATAAVELIASVGGSEPDLPRRERLLLAHALMGEHEDRLRSRVEQGVAELGERVRLLSVATRRTSTLYLTFPDHEAPQVAAHLADRQVLAPAGTFYAHEPAAALGLAERPGLRVGITGYTDDDDVDRLLDGLASALS